MKVLLLTAVPLRNDTNMGKTLLKLFSDFMPEELCCLYLGKGRPNTDACSSYYQFGENEILSSLFTFKPAGSVVLPDMDDKDLMKSQRRSSLITSNKDNILIRLAREFVWNFAKLKSSALKVWLDGQNFDLVFFVLQDTNASIRILDRILTQYDKKTVVYVTDDYVDDFRKHGLFRKRFFKKRRQMLEKVSSRIVKVIGVSDLATEWFEKVLKYNVAGGGENLLYPIWKRMLVDAFA